MDRIKFPKIFHFPWSESLQNDDRMLPSTECFVGKQIVVLQKMDGENQTLTREYIHARSLTDGALTPKQGWSREWIKSLWGSIRYNIPEDIRIHGENLYATHSIEYYDLPNYFFVFGATQNDCFLSWDDVVEWCGLLDLHHVPVIYEGIWSEEKIKSLWPMHSEWSDKVEGYVVRARDSFKIKDFQTNVAKFVRKNHIQADETWFKGEWVENKLRKENSNDS